MKVAQEEIDMNRNLKNFHGWKWFIFLFIALMVIAGCSATRPLVKSQEDIKETQAPPLPATQALEEGRKLAFSQPESRQPEPEERIEVIDKPEAEKVERPVQRGKMIIPEGKEEKGRIVTLDFREEKLRNVLKVFSALTDKNVIATKKTAGLEITIFLRDISPMFALEAICDQYNLWYEETKDYIKVMKLSGRIRMRGGGIACLRFNNQPLCDVLRVFSRETGINVVANENIKDEKVNLLIKDVSPKTAIEVICKKYDLWYEENDGYIRLMRAEDFGKDLNLDYRVKTRIFDLKYASAPQVADAIGCVMGDRVEYNVPEQLKSYEHLKIPEVEEEEGKIEEAKTIETSVTQGKKIEANHFQKNLTSKQLEELLKKRLGFRLTAEDIRMINKELGFALMSVFLRNNCILASSTDDGILKEIGLIIEKLDIPTHQVLIECKILKVSLSDSFTSFFDITYAKLGKRYDIKTEISPGKAFTPKGMTSSNIFYRFINPDDYMFDIAIELLKKDGTVEVTATPMVVTAQNAQAEFFSGFEEWPFVKGIDYREVVETTGVGVSGERRYYIDVDTKLEDVGTKLRITPQINEDETVTLRIHIEESFAEENLTSVPFWNPEAESLVDYDVDVKGVNHIDTIITVPKDYTLALGGLVREENIKKEEKVPLLGDIPLLGFFFKDQIEVKERTERIFLLTPHVMMNPLEVKETSKKTLKGISQHPHLKEE